MTRNNKGLTLAIINLVMGPEDLTTKQIAEIAGTTTDYVRAVASRKQLKLKGSRNVTLSNSPARRFTGRYDLS